MYMIIFKHDYCCYYVALHKNIATLEEAKKMRCAPGDLVVHMQTGVIPTDQTWLFDWEKEKKSASYAYRHLGVSVAGHREVKKATDY